MVNMVKNTFLVIRHGDRTPNTDFPSNPYAEEDWPNGYNSLTVVYTVHYYNITLNYDLILYLDYILSL